jgi:hypothetical protein
LLPKIRDKGKGENTYMVPQNITGRQPASRPLVIVELDMTMDSR